MLSAADLLRNERGRAFLAERGIFADRRKFIGCLRPPVRPDLAELVRERPDQPLLYVGQQACTDYAPATLTKFALARDLQAEEKIVSAILWHDMYQADADRFGTRFLPPGTNVRGIWLIPRAAASQEPRFVPLDPARLEEAWEQLSDWIGNGRDRAAAQVRMRRLRDAMEAARPQTLAGATGAIASFLLRERYGYAPPTTFASTMAKRGLFTEALNNVLAGLDDVVAVFNTAVDDLLALGVDPKVRRLEPDYLPFHYSCPIDGCRLRLKHKRSGIDHHAAASCRCGASYRFHLGSGSAGLGDLEQAGRWSLDVSMPLYHNAVASGWIGGRSTALYGIVLNRVLEEALGERPIPALVPEQLAAPEEEERSGSLLFDYLLTPPSVEAAA